MDALVKAPARTITPIQEFGDQLIRTRDLDPLYCGLVSARLPRDQLARFLLAYWCFYHAGVAAWLSEKEGSEYWQWMCEAAQNVHSPRDYRLPSDRWPRAAERRHFRGEKCVRAVTWLGQQPAEYYLQILSTKANQEEVMNYVQTWPMFGPWIAFKVADMMERVWGAPIWFDARIILMYEEPRKALDLIPQHHPQFRGSTPEQLYQRLLTYFSPRPAPPGGRNCGPQEVETVLCKWKSHVGGHYWLGKDIKEHREGLGGWGATADKLRAAYPAEV